jgi:hypothetical protein
MDNTRLTMKLRVPTLKKSGTSILKTNPESLRKWVANLPLVNVDASVGQLEFGLFQLNGVELPTADRFQALELLTEPVMHITGALQKKHLGKRFPLGKDDLNKSNHTIGLFLAMATGYKLLVDALDREPGAGTQLANPLQRAIRYLSESLIGSYQIYSQHREGIWADLHALYALAAKHGLQAYQEIDTTLQKPALTSVEIAYKQILLLSLAGPYRLHQNEIRQVYNLLGRWAPYCRFHAAKSHDNIGFFTCDLSSDDPPRYLQLTRRDLPDEDSIILDTSGMTEPANATLAELRDKPYLRNILPGENTLKRLMLSWGVMPERQSARRRQEVPVQLVIGLNAIHSLLTEPVRGDAKTMIQETPATDHEDFLYDPTFDRQTVIATKHPPRKKPAGNAGRQNNPFMPAGQHPMRGAYTPGLQARPVDRKQAPAIESWKMVDVSVGGYCMLWESNEVSSAQVGELVALRTGTAESNDGWKLGIIRWMKFTPERGLMLGVQLMASGATPVWACLCRDEPVTESRAQGLLLTENRALKQQPSLLLPSMPFRTGCLSTLSSGEKDERIILVRQLENTGSFAQYHFAMAPAS